MAEGAVRQDGVVAGGQQGLIERLPVRHSAFRNYYVVLVTFTIPSIYLNTFVTLKSRCPYSVEELKFRELLKGQ